MIRSTKNKIKWLHDNYTFYFVKLLKDKSVLDNK